MNENANIPETAIQHEGFWVDAETGEVLGLIDLPKPEFAVVDEDSANWVLRKILMAEAEWAAVFQAPEVIAANAVIENAEKIRKEKEGKLAWLRKRFEPELAEYARKQLEGKKTKTLKTLFGSISFRTVKGGLKVADEAVAIEWAEIHYPDAIKVTKKFLVSAIPEDRKRQIIAEVAGDPFDDHNAAFTVEPDRETVSIKTGVEG